MATWNNFELIAQGTLEPGSSVAAVARIPNSMEIWSVGRDGRILGSYWYEGQANWATYELSPAGSASSQAGVAALSRIPNSMEVWFAGSDGSLQGRYWYEGGIWESYQLAAPGSVMPANGIAALSRIPNSMELFYVGPDASIRDAYWYEGTQWNHFTLAPAGSVDPGTKIAAVSRQSNTMEIWWVGANGSVLGAYWYEGQSGWIQYELAPAGSAAGAVTAVSRLPGAMEVWWIGTNGSVQAAYWYEGQEGGWKRYELAPPGSASLAGSITASSRMPNTMEIWWVGADGSIQDAYWYEGGSWQRFALMPGGTAAANTAIAAVSRRPDAMEIFWQTPNGALVDNYVYVEWTKRDRRADKQVGSPRNVLNVSAISRHPDSIDVVAVGENGAFSASWGEGQSWAHDIDPASILNNQGNIWQPIGDGYRNPAIALTSRRPQLVDAFNGLALSHYGTNTKGDDRWAIGDTRDWFAIGSAGPGGLGGIFAGVGEISAIARTPDNLDVFAVGPDGKVYTSWWAGGSWSGLEGRSWLSLGGSFPEKNAVVTAVTRQPGIIDLFCVGKDGVVYTAWWAAGQNWSSLGRGRGWLPLGGSFATDTAIAAVARTPNNLDLFAVGKSGDVVTAFWNPQNGWSNWLSLGGRFPAKQDVLGLDIGQTSRVSAIARTPNNLDLFAIDADGNVMTSWWWAGGDWSGRGGWQSLGGKFPPGRKVAVVARSPNNIDLFVPGLDGHVYTSWWSAGQDWSGRGGWVRLASEEVYWTKPIETGSLNPIGGRVEVWIRANGTYTFKFHVHNSGAVGVKFMVRATVVLPCGIAITEAFSGFVDADPRNADLTVDRKQDLIRQYWRDNNNFSNWPGKEHGWVDINTEFTGVFGAITDILEAIIGVLSKVAGTAVGVVLGLAHSIGDLVGGLGFSGVLGVIAGAIVMIAPGGTLLLATVAGVGAFTSSEIIRALVKDRELTVGERTLLDAVFQSKVDFNDVRITNVAGLGGRPFTMPGVDGKTYLNLGGQFRNGTAHYTDDYAVASDKQKALLVHEMTHAWQIEHGSFLPGIICAGIENQVNNTLISDHVYMPGPPSTPWRDFNLEQQAQTIEDWYSGQETQEWRNAVPQLSNVDRAGMQKDDPYFHYVRDHIRKGSN
ncbi:hypothetical protein [Sphingomonas sp.]|uniref:hypothetical protein n=1 Tax=Sphingomonas sp. TaxID=28214 RepID=UPI003D6D8D7C